MAVQIETTMIAGASIQLGNLAEWFAAVGTVAAFWSTWYVINRDHKARREEQATAAYDAALAVTITVGPSGKTVPKDDSSIIGVTNEVITIPFLTVNNGSRRTIYDVKVDARIPWDEVLGSKMWEEVPPGQPVFLECNPHDDMWSKKPGAYELDVIATVSFEDSGQVRWLRDSRGTIRRSD